MSKTHVSPLKVQTVPRLELLSAVLLARLMTNVMASLKPCLSFVEPRCFTDSQVALYAFEESGSHLSSIELMKSGS